jgi:hypothetical protein
MYDINTSAHPNEPNYLGLISLRWHKSSPLPIRARSNQSSIGALLVRALFHLITGNKIGAGLLVLVCYIGR